MQGVKLGIVQLVARSPLPVLCINYMMKVLLFFVVSP